MARRVQGSPPWLDLPPELLGLVFLRLPTRTDRAFFPAVCRAWRSAARESRLPPPSPVPWLVRPTGRMNYLLKSHGSLLMVCRKLSYKIGRRYGHEAGSSEFEVRKADLEQHLWADVRTLGNDQALFLGRGCSKAVCVSPYDLSGDCIFFLDDYTDWYWEKTTTSCGVYDMKDRKIYSPLPMVSWINRYVPATWVFWEGETDKLETAGEDFS